MIASRTVTPADAFARANVRDAFTGAGAPAGILEVAEDAATLTIRFDDAVTAAELVDDLIAIESVFVPVQGAPPLDDAAAAAIASVGLGEPDLDAARILETYGEPPA